jgi:hypothetical protein
MVWHGHLFTVKDLVTLSSPSSSLICAQLAHRLLDLGSSNIHLDFFCVERGIWGSNGDGDGEAAHQATGAVGPSSPNAFPQGLQSSCGLLSYLVYALILC